MKSQLGNKLASFIPRLLAKEFFHITDLFNNIVMDDGIEKLAPKANDYELKKRISRVEKALSGVSMQAIAKEEFVSTGAVSSMVKDTLARLAVATREQNDE